MACSAWVGPFALLVKIERARSGKKAKDVVGVGDLGPRFLLKGTAKRPRSRSTAAVLL